MRSVLPSYSAIFQLVVHGLSGLTAFAILVILGHLKAQWGYGLTGTEAIAALWALALDIAEIIGLVDAKKRVRRLRGWWLIAVEFFTIPIMLFLPWAVIGSYDHKRWHDWPCEYYSDLECDDSNYVLTPYAILMLPFTTACMVWAIGCLHFILFVTACVHSLREYRHAWTKGKDNYIELDEEPVLPRAA
ncbi:hypothetical protein QBC38DRAFT_489343 [Podospora fimiseda]|uniref:Uncharacterized protein n=1 Tax=Podospora fimiseda TaxID=252190 RepID=A0AAN7BGR4_9PEZI|nr:hypothetical protein QBC38DRAFT_489343 [Podospora fimiseda]